MDTNVAELLRVIALDRIIPDPDNVRVVQAGDDDFANLVASIKAQGVIQPIVIRPLPPEFDFIPDNDGEPVHVNPDYMVVVGHRRFAAAKAAGLDGIPAVIREGMQEGAVTLMQLSENRDRAEMSVIDTWAAVDTAIKRGLSPATVALALNRSERQVLQFQAMGGLHPIIKAHIRETNSVPDPQYLRVICQASQERQAEAFESAMTHSGGGWSLWRDMKSALTVTRIPMRLARFDTERYTGPTSGDLFDTQDQTYALDAKLFMELQREWIDERCAAMVKAGFHDVATLEPAKHGYQWATPAGVAGEHRYIDFPLDKNGKDKMPPRKARPDLIYAVGMRDTGEVQEYLYEKKQPKPKPKKKAKTPGEPEPDPLEGVGSDFSVAFTQKGVERLEKAKRDCLAAALDEDSPLARETDVVIGLLAYLLSKQIRPQSYQGPFTPEFPFITPEGQIDIDGKVPELIAYARELAGFAVQQKHQVDRAQMERIGAWLNAPVSYPVTTDDLAHLKGPGLVAIGRVLGWDDKAHPRQKDKRVAIMGALDKLLPAHLPTIGWQVEPPLARVARYASSANTGMSPAERGWSDEQDEDPEFCGRASGTKGCPCGWPEEPCENGPESGEAEGAADSAVAGALAAPGEQDTAEEDSADWERDREEQDDPQEQDA